MANTGSGDVTVRLRIDTSEAKRSLEELNRAGNATAQDMNTGARSTIGKAFGWLGVGGLIGLGVEGVTAASRSGFGSIVGETTGYYGTQIGEAVFGSLNDQARAASSSRDQTIDAFAMQVGQLGYIPQGVKDFYHGVDRINQIRERGTDIINSESSFYGPGVGQLLGQVMSGIGSMISTAADRIAQAIAPKGK